MKSTLPLITVSILVFMVGRYTAPSVAPAISPETSKKLQTVLDSDYADYQRLKTLEEKYKKADEILGKIMVIFLADLQLRTPAPVVQSARTVAPTATLSSPQTPTSTPSISPHPQSVSEPPRPRVQAMAIKQVHDEEQAKKFIESKRQDNLQSTWTNAEVMKRLPANLEGCFAGMYSADDGGETAPITLFHKMISPKEIQTVVAVHFRSGGRNRTRGTGSLSGYRRSDENSVMIESGDWIYDIYFVPNLDGWVGNVYKKQTDESRKPIGRVMLARGSNCEQ